MSISSRSPARFQIKTCTPGDPFFSLSPRLRMQTEPARYEYTGFALFQLLNPRNANFRLGERAASGTNFTELDKEKERKRERELQATKNKILGWEGGEKKNLIMWRLVGQSPTEN